MSKLKDFISTPQKFWLLVTAILILFFWVFSSSLMPFLIGFILAYILTPIADFLEKKGLHRMISTNLVIIGFMAILILFGLLFVPLIIQQGGELVKNAPEYGHKILTYLNQKYADTPVAEIWADVTKDFNIKVFLTDAFKNTEGMTQDILGSVLSGSLGFVKFVTSVIVMFIAAFYLILDWHKLVAKIDSWLPRHHQDTIKKLFRQVDYLQSSYIRGQLLVCMIMATYYIIAFGSWI